MQLESQLLKHPYKKAERKGRDFDAEYTHFEELHAQFDRDLEVYASLIDGKPKDGGAAEMPADQFHDSEEHAAVEALLKSHRQILGQSGNIEIPFR